MNESAPNIDRTELAECRLRAIGKPVTILMVVGGMGAVSALANFQFVENGQQRFLLAWLVAFAFVLSVSLGGLFFVLIQHLMRAGWSVVVRRLAEVLCLNLVVVAVLFLPIGWSVWNGDGLIYRWAKSGGNEDHSHLGATELNDRAEKELLSGFPLTPSPFPHEFGETLKETAERERTKSQGEESKVVLSSYVLPVSQNHASAPHLVHKPYLNRTRFLVTWVGLFVVWIGLALFYYRNSVAQDKSQDARLTLRMESWSGVAALLFAFSLTMAAFDLLMSLDAAWYSTIFGVYYFAGCAVAGLATLLLSVLLLKRFDLTPAVFAEELQRDLGRLLFAFVFFWAYIAFSQYMLLWYANMPETTGWMVKRGMSTATGYTNSWGWLAIFLLVAHFAIPFMGIMSRHVKSNSNAMIFWTVWMLVVHYFDLYWIVIPENHPGFTISFVEIGTAVLVIAIYGIAALWLASRASLFAVGDPRLEESLSRHAMY